MGETTGARYLARALDAYGVSAVFLVPTVLSATLVALEEETSVRRVVAHGEKAAAYMADGYARATGRPGVCMAQNIGAANLAAGLRDAYLGCSPVLALTGGPYEHSRGRNYYQEIEDFPLFKPVTRSSRQVHDAARLPDMLDQAFRDATVGKPGPVHLELAGHTGDVAGGADPGRGGARTAGAPRPRGAHRTGPRRGRRGRDGPARRAAPGRRLRRRRARPRAPQAEVVALAERLGVPLATSLNGKDTVPADHPLAIGVPGPVRPCQRQPGAARGRPRPLRRQPDRQPAHADLAGPARRARGSSTSTWTRGSPVVTSPAPSPSSPTHASACSALLDALGDVDVTATAAWRERAATLAARWRDEIEVHALLRGLPAPSRAPGHRPRRPAARRRARRRRHRPRRHVDRGPPRPLAAGPGLPPRRGLARLGPAGRHRRPGRPARRLGRRVHRRRRPLLPPERAGDRGPLAGPARPSSSTTTPRSTRRSTRTRSPTAAS